MWMLLWGKLECLSIFFVAADFKNTHNVACVVCLFQNNNKFHFKNVMSINICQLHKHFQHPSTLTFSTVPLAWHSPKRTTVPGWRSRAVRGRRGGRHVIWWRGWRWAESLSWRLRGQQHTLLTGTERYNTMAVTCDFIVFIKCLSLKKAEGIVLFTLWPPLCSLCQTRRCTVFTWSQWGALQSRASSKCPTEIITTWTYFHRYTVYFILSFSLLK